MALLLDGIEASASISLALMTYVTLELATVVWPLAFLAAMCSRNTFLAVLDVFGTRRTARDRTSNGAEYLAAVWVSSLYVAAVGLKGLDDAIFGFSYEFADSIFGLSYNLLSSAYGYCLLISGFCVATVIVGAAIQGLLWLGARVPALVKAVESLLQGCFLWVIEIGERPTWPEKKICSLVKAASEAFFNAIALTPEEEQLFNRYQEILQPYIQATRAYGQKITTATAQVLQDLHLGDLFEMYCNTRCQTLFKTDGSIVREVLLFDQRVDPCKEAIREYLNQILGRITKFTHDHEQAIETCKVMIQMAIYDLTPSFLHSTFGIADPEVTDLFDDEEDDTDVMLMKGYEAATDNPVKDLTNGSDISADRQPKSSSLYNGRRESRGRELKKEIATEIAAVKKAEAMKEIKDVPKSEDSKSPLEQAIHPEVADEDGWEMIEAGEEDANWKWLKRDPERR